MQLKDRVRKYYGLYSSYLCLTTISFGITLDILGYRQISHLLFIPFSFFWLVSLFQALNYLINELER